MKIICCDDEKNLLNLHKTLLESIDGVEEVMAFSYPEDVLDHIATNKEADVAFLDINMPGMDGLELARRIKNSMPDIKIIFVTGYPEYKQEANESGCSGYLIKPASLNEIKKELEYAMHGSEAVVENRIKVHCFGNFEIFVDGVQVQFNLTKSKELLAYLIDRQGASVTGGEMCAILWEDEGGKESAKNYLRRCYKDLKDTLEAINAGDILVKGWNSYGVNPAAFWCDAYEFNKGNIQVINSYRGEYMSQYSWSDFRVVEFDKISKKY